MSHDYIHDIHHLNYRRAIDRVHDEAEKRLADQGHSLDATFDVIRELRVAHHNFYRNYLQQTKKNFA